MHGQPQITQADPQAQLYGLVFGSGSKSPFTPPRTVPCHTLSVAQLILLTMTRRDQPKTIAEVGVWQGVNARWLLTMFPNCQFHLIDPFQAGVPGTTWFDKGDRFAKCPQAQHDAHFDIVSQLCRQFSPRATLHRAGREAAAEFADGSLDVVFLDGAHDYANVKADIFAWVSKVRKGGYLAGHDYHEGGNYFGLIDAVEEATAALGLTLECYAGKVWACRIGGSGKGDFVSHLANRKPANVEAAKKISVSS